MVVDGDLPFSQPAEMTDNTANILVQLKKGQHAYKCGFCGAYFQIIEELAFHQEQHPKAKAYQCGYCKAAFDSSLELSAHNSAHEVFEYVDPFGNSNSKVYLIKNPIVPDVATEQLQNEMAGPEEQHQDMTAQAEHDGGMKSDSNINGNDNPDAVTTGEGELDQAGSMGNYQQKPNCSAEVPLRAADGTIECPICGEGFQVLEHLKEHSVSEHNDDRPFHCTNCPKCFKELSHLNNHYAARHSSKRSHVCPVCGKTFKVGTNLRTHIRNIHHLDPTIVLAGPVRTKVFHGDTTCPVCGEKFQSQNEMKRHCLDEHDDNRPFQCPHCPSSSTTYQKLNDHIASKHSDDMPLSCPECGRKFKVKSSLWNHVYMKHRNTYRMKKAT